MRLPEALQAAAPPEPLALNPERHDQGRAQGAMAYETHPQLRDIEDDDTVLWRYMDLYRYLDLLQTAELHLTRADQMEDRWEGAYGPLNVTMRPTVYAESWEMMAPHFEGIYLHARTHTYLNCWYMGDHESYAMWKLYDATGKGVAIRTTAGRLKASLIGERMPPLSGAMVQYVDYAATYIPEGNLFFPYVRKRVSFAHESEYRLLGMWSPQALEVDERNTAVRHAPDIPPLFQREPIDVTKLVEVVYVSPDAPSWVVRVISEVTRKYPADIEVHQSDLAADPVY
jgi:hypothetical protein